MQTYGDLAGLVAIVQAIGPLGLLIYIYWRDQRKIDHIQAETREYVRKFTESYDKNIVFINNYEVLAKALAEIITLNTQQMTTVIQMIKDNQWCPLTKTRRQVTETIEREPQL